jgi:GAF domain-containing protein
MAAAQSDFIKIKMDPDPFDNIVPPSDLQRSGLAQLNELTMALSAIREPRRMLGTILETIVRLHDTDHGFLSLRNSIGHLEVSAIVGFDESIIDDLKKMKLGEGSCGTTMRSKNRTIVEDTDADPLFKNLKTMTQKHGFRAVHTTPILNREGECIGVLAVHFRRPRRPSEMEILLTDMYVREAAEFMERMRFEKALERSEKQLRLAMEKADIGIWEMDLSQKTGSWSGAAVEMLGGGKKPFSGDIWLQICHDDDREKCRKSLGRHS